MRTGNVANWIRKQNRMHDEAGLDLDRVKALNRTLGKTDHYMRKWQSERDKLTPYIQLTGQIHIPGTSGDSGSVGTVGGAEAVRMVMYRSHGRALGGMAIAALIAETIVASMLAPQFLFSLSPAVAIIATVAIALSLAVLSHGTFVTAFDTDRPLRQIRILRITSNVSIAACVTLLTPLLLSRVIALPYPEILLNLPLALLALFLPLAAGVCSALRTIYLRAWDDPGGRCDALEAAIVALQSWRIKWKEELELVGRSNTALTKVVSEKESA